MRLNLRGAENLPNHPVAVDAANHTSYMDTPVIFAALPFQFRILARKELWGMPFIGWHLNRSGQIPIDTADPHSTLSSLGAGARALRAGMPLFVFPEGGRTNNGRSRPSSPAQLSSPSAPRSRSSPLRSAALTTRSPSTPPTSIPAPSPSPSANPSPPKASPSAKPNSSPPASAPPSKTCESHHPPPSPPER